MRRLALVYVLFAAVIASAAGLAYYGYSYSSELSSRERAVIMDTMRELAEEKVLGIESELLKSDRIVFTGIDFDDLPGIRDLIRSSGSFAESILILDDDQMIVPGGYQTKRQTGSQEFRKLFEEQIRPELHLERVVQGQRGHLHAMFDGRPYLFSYVRAQHDDRTYFVVLEEDLAFLVGSVFPQFFGVSSPRLYQVVNDVGELIYGFDFAGIPTDDIVELPFVDTVSRWRLRVAQKDASALRGDTRRQLVDVILIGVALAVIIAGLAVLLMAVQRERRANELKSEFISNVSHELKTPLSIISMFGEMLASGRTKSSAQATEYAEIIWRESVRLSRLIDNVLDFAKIERGVDVYEFAEGDVGEVVPRALELSRHRLERADLEVEADVADDLPMQLIDANALTLAVLNLVDNAIKYAAEGEKLVVAAYRENGRVYLSVRDFGPGIAADEHHAIFDRFYRAKDVRLRPIRGSGIGLALVKHIALAHGGGVEVASAAGQGATFRVWIPAAQGE